MLTVGIAGANGYVGRALCKAFEKKPGTRVVRITRENHASMKAQSFEVLINSAMPSGRFWAKQNPEKDFTETVEKTRDFVQNWKYKKFIQISSVSARCQLDTVYGRHKAEAEKECKPGALIVRLTAMFSPELSKGALIDILNGRKVFVSGESRYGFASLDFVAGWIAGHLDREGIVELGARDTVSLAEIAKRTGEKIEFEGAVDVQEVQNPEPDFPAAEEVFLFMERMKNKV